MRWRALTPEQANAILRAVADGANPRDLAPAYSVSLRTIYRTLNRAVESMEVVEVLGHRATFVRGDDDEPIRMTPWVPA